MSRLGGGRSFCFTVTSGGPTTLWDCEVPVVATWAPDPAQSDTIKAVTSIPRVQPDLEIKQAGNWLGNDEYNDDGTDQTGSRAVLAGTTAVYQARLYNDGSETETFWIKGPAGDADWTVQYFQGTTEVTAQVTSATGWKRPNVAPGAMRAFTIKVTPSSGLPAKSCREVLVRAESNRDPTQRDTIKAVTRVK